MDSCACHQVGVKGNPKNVNRGLDCDVIVAEVSDGLCSKHFSGYQHPLSCAQLCTAPQWLEFVMLTVHLGPRRMPLSSSVQAVG